MSKWVIDKTFDFCYGHRVWTQKLNGHYANDLKCACRHLHGHEATVRVFLTGDKLDNTGMITDFRHLEWLKNLFNAIVDHRFIIDKNDPLFDKIVGNDKILKNETVSIEGNVSKIIAQSIDLDKSGIIFNTPEYEYYEGLLIVNFVPTSENLSAWVALFVESVMAPLNVTVSKIEWFETPRSRSTFINE
jgi:6-pyruvoyltetrahydropterin/6-carboxytetrahydropterin synthase